MPTYVTIYIIRYMYVFSNVYTILVISRIRYML